MHFYTQSPTIREVTDFISDILASLPDLDSDTRHAFASNAIRHFFGVDMLGYSDDLLNETKDTDESMDDEFV